MRKKNSKSMLEKLIDENCRVNESLKIENKKEIIKKYKHRVLIGMKVKVEQYKAFLPAGEKINFEYLRNRISELDNKNKISKIFESCYKIGLSYELGVRYFTEMSQNGLFIDYIGFPTNMKIAERLKHVKGSVDYDIFTKGVLGINKDIGIKVRISNKEKTRRRHELIRNRYKELEKDCPPHLRHRIPEELAKEIEAGKHGYPKGTKRSPSYIKTLRYRNPQKKS